MSNDPPMTHQGSTNAESRMTKGLELRHSAFDLRHSLVIGGSLGFGNWELPQALLPGSFCPLHHGHTTLAAVAAARLGVPVHFELSVTNVDKPELPREEIERRVSQFAEVAPVWITRAATFEAKAALFPGVAFVVG